MAVDSQSTPVNRLAQETSPYLLQHKHNPVDWYAWGTEAFDLARRENKPIFLSVGYSTCYWCHVMERQSFENAEIAALMNRLFVCIKVDREERPDVDQLYMTAVQILTRQGGWPMSVWLTPDLRPFYGGTYYPPHDQQGRPGLPRVCLAIDDAWRNRPAEVSESADGLTGMLRRLATPLVAASPVTIDLQTLSGWADRLASDYEPRHGGFGYAPKFPRQTVLEFLLDWITIDNAPAVGGRLDRAELRKRLLHTLDAMMYGGIRDQLGGGFHRYSTDSQWLVPHFEIMLYDNAMLLTCYAKAFHLTGDARYAQVARDIADFVLRDMTSPRGAFYTAFDAEVDAQEGLSYLWTPEEAEEALTAEEAAWFKRVYGLDEGFNFADPHHGTGVEDKNVLFVASPNDEPSPLLDPNLRAIRQKLLAHRNRRKQPLLDTKVLTSWNALMIRGLAVAGRLLKEDRYVAAARTAAEYVLTEHRRDDGGLYRTSRDGVRKHLGALDDYAFLAWALTELAVASGDGHFNDSARSLLLQVEQRFGESDFRSSDPAAEGSRAGPDEPTSTGGFAFTDRAADDLIVRQQTAQDSPLPSGNAAAALAFVALGDAARAAQVVGRFAPQLGEQVEGMASLAMAALTVVRQTGDIHVPATAFKTGGSARRKGDSETQPAATPAPATPRAKDLVAIDPHWTSPTRLIVRCRVADGYHLNANNVATDATLVPTRLSVEPADAVRHIVFPVGSPLASDGSTMVYADKFEVEVEFVKPPGGTAPLKLKLSFQPCTDVACLTAMTVEQTIAAPAASRQ